MVQEDDKLGILSGEGRLVTPPLTSLEVVEELAECWREREWGLNCDGDDAVEGND